MSQQNDFFEDEQSGEFGDNGFPLPADDLGVKVSGKSSQGSSSRRLILLVLLLLLLAAGAVFYLKPDLVDSLMGVEKAPPAPQRQPVKIPVKKPVAPKPQAPAAPVNKVVKEVMPAAPVAVPATAVEKVSPPVVQSATPKAAATVSPAPTRATPPVAPRAGSYTVTVGSFVLDDNISHAQKAIKALGYQPLLKTGKTNVSMVRLRLGSFSKAEGQAELSKLRQVATDAFALFRDGQMVVYAGSYYTLDKARAFADRLYAKGIRLEEETVQVSVPLTAVSFGAFATRADAEKAAGRARVKGFDASIEKVR